MTPKAWFAAIDPSPLLAAIRADQAMIGQQLRVRTRRLRLFACAAARQVWHMLSADACSAILASERYAEGRATLTDLVASAIPRQIVSVTASQMAQEAASAASYVGVAMSGPPGNQPSMSLHTATNAAISAARAIATREIGPAPPGRPTTPEWHKTWTAAFASARAVQAEYIRDIFPPPQYIPTRDPRWITSTVLALARQMDESGDFSTVPILADALQDAGCEDDRLLSSCRTSRNNHVRGNWIVDLILERT